MLACHDMSIVIRAEDEPAAARLEYLRHAVRDTIVPFEIQVDAEPDFSSRIVAGAAERCRSRRWPARRWRPPGPPA